MLLTNGKPYICSVKLKHILNYFRSSHRSILFGISIKFHIQLYIICTSLEIFKICQFFTCFLPGCFNFSNFLQFIILSLKLHQVTLHWKKSLSLSREKTHPLPLSLRKKLTTKVIKEVKRVRFSFTKNQDMRYKSQLLCINKNFWHSK